MDAVLVDNAADPEQVAAGGRKEKRDARERRNLVATQLSTPAGRQFVWDDLGRHGIFRRIVGSLEEVYAANAAANKGRELLEEITDQHPDAFLLMQAEAVARQKAQRAELEAAKLGRRRPQTETESEET